MSKCMHTSNLRFGILVIADERRLDCSPSSFQKEHKHHMGFCFFIFGNERWMSCSNDKFYGYVVVNLDEIEVAFMLHKKIEDYGKIKNPKIKIISKLTLKLTFVDPPLWFRMLH